MLAGDALATKGGNAIAQNRIYLAGTFVGPRRAVGLSSPPTLPEALNPARHDLLTNGIDTGCLRFRQCAIDNGNGHFFSTPRCQSRILVNVIRSDPGKLRCGNFSPPNPLRMDNLLKLTSRAPPEDSSPAFEADANREYNPLLNCIATLRR